MGKGMNVAIFMLLKWKADELYVFDGLRNE